MRVHVWTLITSGTTAVQGRVSRIFTNWFLPAKRAVTRWSRRNDALKKPGSLRRRAAKLAARRKRSPIADSQHGTARQAWLYIVNPNPLNKIKRHTQEDKKTTKSQSQETWLYVRKHHSHPTARAPRHHQYQHQSNRPRAGPNQRDSAATSVGRPPPPPPLA